MNSKTIKTVLIVEDDASIVLMYKDKLKLEGFSVRTVMDGRKAMQRIKQGADLILLDILLPGVNGFELLKKIKSDSSLKNIPVIVLTNIGGESFDKDKSLAISLGASDYMVKSLNTPATVVSKIKEYLD